jgi:hypothetical protein
MDKICKDCGKIINDVYKPRKISFCKNCDETIEFCYQCQEWHHKNGMQFIPMKNCLCKIIIPKEE